MAESNPIFQTLKADLGKFYIGPKYKWLKFCLFQHLEVGDITNPDFIGNDLFNALEDKGCITPTNVNLLQELTELTDIKKAENLVKSYMKLHNQVQTRPTDEKLSSDRRKMFKAMRQVDPTASEKVISSFNLRDHHFTCIWDVVLHLEINKRLCDDNQKEQFASCLGKPVKDIFGHEKCELKSESNLSSQTEDHTYLSQQTAEAKNNSSAAQKNTDKSDKTSDMKNNAQPNEFTSGIFAQIHFKQKRYDKMEEELVQVDKQTKSSYGRGIFTTMISRECNDFAEFMHDCSNHKMTDVKVLHERACTQFFSLAESHIEILKEIGIDSTECTICTGNIFTEWAKHLELIFKKNSSLKYGSPDWKHVIFKTKELERFLSSLSTPARNVSKSCILLMLQVICRMWLYRNHLIPEDKYGLLLVATFALPLCESKLVASKYFCAVKHDMYVHAAITIGCNILNSKRAVKDWHDEFYRFKQRCKELYKESLELKKNIRSEDDNRNWDKFTSLVVSRLNQHFEKCKDDHRAGSTTDRQDTLIEQIQTITLKRWNESSGEFRQAITEARNQLKDISLCLKSYNRLESPLELVVDQQQKNVNNLVDLNINKVEDDAHKGKGNYRPDKTTDEQHTPEEQTINTQDNTYASKPHSTQAGEKTEMKSKFNTNTENNEETSTEHVSDIEDVEQSKDLMEHYNCNLAKRFFKQKRFDKMEEVLVKVDRQTKSAYGRKRFATKISQGCNDFAELHDCIDHQLTNVNVLHELACSQFSSLAESHREVLKEMDMETECIIFTEFATHLHVIFMENSPLEYGSLKWKTLISKAEELERFFSSLPIPARNVSKSYILLMLQFICRMWLYRNHLIPEDLYGLLLVATFALPLCESELVASKYFCEVKHDMYVHAAITIGCNISNLRLAVKDWYDEFCRFTQRCEQLYDEGLKMNKDIRSEDDTRNLKKFTSLVQSRLKTADLHFDIDQDDYIPHRTTDEHHRLTEQNVTTVLSHWNDKSYDLFCQSITEAENQLKDTGFRLQVGSWLSPRYKDACNVLNGSYKQLDSSQSLAENLRHYLMELVVDCRRLLKDLKIYSNDSMTDWFEVFSRFCSANDCVFGSPEWHAVLDRAKTTVENMSRGANVIGRTITQLYVQLFIELMKKAFLTYQQITPKDRLGHVRLALINMTMVKSPLLSSKWYASMRFNVYLCGLRSIASCLLEAEKPNKDTFYQEYKNVKENIDSLIVESRKFKLPFASKEELEKFRALHKAVKQNMTGRSDSRSKVIASDPDVSRLVETAVAKCQQRDYDQMTKHLDDAEEKDGSCDVRLAFAGNISTEFHLVVTFSNNIPEESGLSTVEETTKKYLFYLANDHQNLMKCMNEHLSNDMKTLTVDLFTLPNVMPGTPSWITLERNAKQMVQYFESLTKNGQSVTKCYILLFLTVIHNFIATRNRLRRAEHFRLLTFILPCRLICESKLLESNAWIKTKFEVYEVVVLTTGAALGTGQIPCDLRYPDYWKVYDELVERGKQCGIELTNANKQEHMDRMRRDGLNLCNGTEDRMCITAALLYHRAGCYKGLMLILNAANQTRSVQNIRMNFTMRVSHVFEKCVDYHNKISDANTYGELVEKSYHYLSTAAKDFLKVVENMGETTSNDLVRWVDEIFQATNGKPELYPVLEIESVTEKCNMASVSIQRMSEEAKCIAQTYLEFFMSFIMNFVTRRYQLHVKNVYNGGLKITMAVIMLCKDVLVTSNFSVKQKQDTYSVAATYMTELSEDDVWTDKMEFVLNELPNLKLQRKKFDEICRKRERQKNVWPNNERQAEQSKIQDQKPCERNTEIVDLYVSSCGDDQVEDFMKKKILLPMNA